MSTSTPAVRYPGYRIVAHYGGTTYGWPVSADRIVEALANRLSKVDPEIEDDEAHAEAELLIRRVDENGGQEIGTDIGTGRLWLTGLDPASEQGRDTLGAIGITTLTWPV